MSLERINWRCMLFGAQERMNFGRFRRLIFLLPLLMLAYAFGFHGLSGHVFGHAYVYPLTLVLLSSLLIPSLSLEYFGGHSVFTRYGARGMFIYSVGNLMATSVAVFCGLLAGGMTGLVIAMVIKQLMLPAVFLSYQWREFHAV
jgi:hypothetical protein